MGKPRMTPLAMAIKAAEPLSDEEKQTLRDILRPAPKPRQKGKSKPAQKRKVGKDSDNGQQPLAEQRCTTCQGAFGVNAHHMKSDPAYHEFVSGAA